MPGMPDELKKDPETSVQARYRGLSAYLSEWMGRE